MAHRGLGESDPAAAPVNDSGVGHVRQSLSEEWWASPWYTMKWVSAGETHLASTRVPPLLPRQANHILSQQVE